MNIVGSSFLVLLSSILFPGCRTTSPESNTASGSADLAPFTELVFPGKSLVVNQDFLNLPTHTGTETGYVVQQNFEEDVQGNVDAWGELSCQFRHPRSSGELTLRKGQMLKILSRPKNSDRCGKQQSDRDKNAANNFFDKNCSDVQRFVVLTPSNVHLSVVCKQLVSTNSPEKGTTHIVRTPSIKEMGSIFKIQ